MITFFAIVAVTGACLVYLDRASAVPDSIPVELAGHSAAGTGMIVIGVFGAFCAWALP
jgi:hypothetical protein